MTKLTVAEAKDQLADLLAKASRGEEVVIAAEAQRRRACSVTPPSMPTLRSSVGLDNAFGSPRHLVVD